MNVPQFKRQRVLKMRTILRPNVTDRQRERAREGLLISILYATLHLVTGQSLWPSSRGRRARLPGLPAGRPRQLLERRGRRKRSRARHRTRPIATSCYSIQIQKNGSGISTIREKKSSNNWYETNSKYLSEKSPKYMVMRNNDEGVYKAPSPRPL